MNNRTTDHPIRNPITRRSALGAGLASLVAAGTASVLPTQTEPTTARAEAAVTVIHVDDLAEQCKRLHAEMAGYQHTQNVLEEETHAQVGFEIMNPYTSAVTEAWVAQGDWLVAELARHLPGLAPTIMMLALHISSVAYSTPGACCTVAEGFEP